MRIPDIDYTGKCCGYVWFTKEVDVPIVLENSRPDPEVVGIEWIKQGLNRRLSR
jgi:hypothetical protein